MSKKLQKTLFFLAAASAALPAAVIAQTNTNDPYAAQKIMGETVVITAARTQQKLLDTDASISVVSSKDIQTSSNDNVPDLLQHESGVNLSSDGTPGVKHVAIRGESPSRTLILVDGQRVDDQKTKSGAPMLINPYFVDRIEVLKGPSSVLYGSDAIGGIVNVITKKPSQKPVELEAGLAFNSAYNGFTEYANLTGTVEKFKYALGAFNTNNGDMYMADRKRLDHSAYSAHGFNGDLSYDLTDKVEVGYSGEYFDADAETTTSTDVVKYQNFRGDIPTWERQKHKIYVKAHDISEYLAAAETSVYFQKNYKEYNSVPYAGINVGVDNDQKTYGGNIQLEWSLGDRFYLVSGYDGRRDNLDSTGYFKMNLGPVAGDIDMSDKDYSQDSHSLYALLSTYLTDELTLNTGIRYNYVKTNSGTSRINGSMTIPGMPMPYPLNYNITNKDTSQSKAVGSVGLVFKPFDKTAFRANWSQGYRVPNVQELFLTTFSGGEMQMGNPDLKPEESNNYELGARYEDNNGLIADVSVFYTQADDYIENYETTRPGMPMRTFSYHNIAKANTWGSELSLSYLIAGAYEPYVNLTYMKREYKTSAGSTTNTGTPSLFGNAGLKFHADKFTLDTYVKFASHTKNDNLDGSAYLGKYEYGGYATYNLKASYSFGSEDQFTVFASAENISDKSYQTSEYIMEPGRFFTIGVNGKF